MMDAGSQARCSVGKECISTPRRESRANGDVSPIQSGPLRPLRHAECQSIAGHDRAPDELMLPQCKDNNDLHGRDRGVAVVSSRKGATIDTAIMLM